MVEVTQKNWLVGVIPQSEHGPYRVVKGSDEIKVNEDGLVLLRIFF